MIRGYVGFYKGNYLKSSYEYAYARYLDFINKKWKYEQQSFDLGECYYTPDFFIYDEDNNLEYIVETKSNKKEYLEKAEKKVKLLKDKYDINGYVVSHEGLRIAFSDTPLSLSQIIKEWQKSENTYIPGGSAWKYMSKTQVYELKKAIGEATKERWLNPKLRILMIEGSKKGAQKNKDRKGRWFIKRRETRKCEKCNESFIVIESSKKVFCGYNCSTPINAEKGTINYLINIKKNHEQIKEFSSEWVEKNKEKIIHASFTKVQPTLEELMNVIEKRYGVKDIRVITEAIIGEKKGRKDLLAYFKGMVIKEELKVLKDEKNPRLEVKLYMEKWAKNNREYLEESDFKKARSVLKPLSNEVNIRFGFKEDSKHRMLQRAIFDRDAGCNNVLLYLKSLLLEEIY